MNAKRSQNGISESRVTSDESRGLWRRIATAIGVIGATVALHEAAHALAAARGGAEVKEIGVGFGPTLMRTRVRSLPVVLRALPLGGYAAVDVEQIPPRQRIRMLLAGPLANIVFGLALALAMRRHPPAALGEGRTIGLTGFVGTLSALIRAAGQGPEAVARLTGAINVGLGLMNLMPVYPLDGGHVVMSVMEAYGASPRARAAFARLTSAMFAVLVQTAMLADMRKLIADLGAAGAGTLHTRSGGS